MKNFVKLLVLALATAMVAALLMVGIFATLAMEPEADPTKLVPGSDRVIFIKDAPRDENYVVTGELEGDGTGSDPANPLRVLDHEMFDPSSSNPKWHLQTAFYQATEMLAETGGTIVICGPVYFGAGESYGSGSGERDVYTARFGNNVIKFTSVYNGVDYRETANAKIIIEAPATLSICGSSVWENIDIATASASRVICFSNYATLVGNGVNCYPTNDAYLGIAQNYISLAAGQRYAKSNGETPTLTVMSGAYNYVCGAWGTVNTTSMENANVNLTLGGTTTVLGVVSGTVKAKMGFSGNVNITINGGTYKCDIFGVGSTGMLNTDGIVNIKINGGNFKNAWSISDAAIGVTNNIPATCTVDFSDWTGKIIDLAFANNIITGIDDVKYPVGVTEAQLVDLIENYNPSYPEGDLDYVESLLEGTGLTLEYTAKNNPVITVPLSSDGNAMTVAELGELIDNDDVSIIAVNGVIGTGCKLVIGEYILQIAVKGDIDGDGISTVYDAAIIKKNIANNGFAANDVREFAGDFDGTNGTDDADVYAILAHIVGETFIA